KLLLPKFPACLRQHSKKPNFPDPSFIQSRAREGRSTGSPGTILLMRDRIWPFLSMRSTMRRRRQTTNARELWNRFDSIRSNETGGDQHLLLDSFVSSS